MPIPRNRQAASAKRRVAARQSLLRRRVTSAPTANASGIEKSVYPEYSIGGWNIIAGWRSSGLRPVPSGGAAASVLNGLSKNSVSIRKNEAKPSRTAVATGAISRTRRRVSASTRLDQTDRSHTHSSSAPSCEDQAAVAL